MKGNTLNQKRPAPSLILQTRSPTHQPPNPRILPAENDTQSPGDAVVLTPVPPPGPPPPPENIPDTMTRSLGFSLPVTVVVLAIAYIYFSTVFIFIDRWFGLMSSPGLMNAVVFTGVAVMCVFNYSASVFRDPGRVPSTYMPDVEDSGNPMHEIKRKMCMHQMENLYLETLTDLSTKGGDLRYCQKCSHYKPARAHHCRVCKRCVLRMDHHCIWINNCVGHANYKVFFIFVVYAVIACLYSLVLLVGSLTYDPEKEDQEPGDSFQTAYVISGLLLVPLCVALSVLLALLFPSFWQYHEGVRGMWLAEKGGQIYSHPYDRGAYENLTTVLGSNICSWALPTSGHIGSGLHFRTAYDYPSGASMSE
ncbi:probable protein S-acyltransferase 16 isoform X4 [Pyrus x bretschneideri]|uniref:probable protein S-acyltransferase 16 isoform X4 n=1 Tax=Pyrus x bretschneideri TaxID=225117 RepID=UPI00202FEFEF|nr:probable protein S-acyltransferase 16 isoform X4 [Pyrus x bretschneideri]